MSRELIIDSTLINDESECYVIAEIGHNHQGDVEKAKKIIKAAHECGVHAVKFQKRENQSLFTRAMFDMPYNNENGFGATYGLHREALEFGRSEYRELKQFSAQLGITFFATAFDPTSADFLADLEVPAFKIASGDLKNTPLLKHIAKLSKPILLSTGGGTMTDVQRAVDTIMPINSQLCIMQCTANYPVEPEDMNLRVISTYREKYPDIVIGLSDHQNGIAMSLIGYMLGARVIEKHFTINRAWKGTDQSFSVEPIGMHKLVRDLQRAQASLGDGVKKALACEEKPLLKMSKKLVAARNLPVGTILGERDIAIKSPGDGLPPYELFSLIGHRLIRDIPADENITFDHLEK